MNNDQLTELLVEQVKDLYDAEKQLVKALPKLARACKSEELSAAFAKHNDETKGHVSRLEQVFDLLEVPARGKSCKAMKGLLEEGSEVIKDEDKGHLRDLALIAGAQRVEHYEISAYGTVRAIAEQMKNAKIAKLLGETAAEESAADQKLSKLANSLYQMEA